MLRPWLTSALAAFLFFAFAAGPWVRAAHAAAPSPALMTRLAAHAAQLDAVRKGGSCSVEGKLEELDSKGTADGVKELKGRLEGDGTRTRLDVRSYLEDGEDKTAEFAKKSRERADKNAKDPEAKKRELKVPFLASEQARYTFDVAEVDKADASRVRITFVPVAKDETTIEGSAWVDERGGTLLSAGFKLSRTSMWVDYVHVQVEFGAPTPLGPALSKVSMDGRGGILFLRKRFHAQATLSDYRMVNPPPHP